MTNNLMIREGPCCLASLHLLEFLAALWTLPYVTSQQHGVALPGRA